MATGPGKYDDIATVARESAKARAVVVAVIGGEHGNGFSVQAEAGTLLNLPDLLEEIALQIRRDLERSGT